jgi:hypothetical protein
MGIVLSILKSSILSASPHHPLRAESITQNMASSRRSPNRRKLDVAPYFFIVVFLFASVTMYMNGTYINYPSVTLLETSLQDSLVGRSSGEVRDKDEVAGELAGLSCERYGGPPPEAAQDMVYWQDIPEGESRRGCGLWRRRVYLLVRDSRPSIDQDSDSDRVLSHTCHIFLLLIFRQSARQSAPPTPSSQQ